MAAKARTVRIDADQIARLQPYLDLKGLSFLVGGEINSTIEHAAAEHGHPEAKAEGQMAA